MTRFVLSLNHESDFQQAQAAAGKEAARRLGVNLEILFCYGDPIEQSQQLLTVIQSQNSASSIHGIVVQPVGTGLRQVAEAAAAAGIGWAVLYREVDYTAELVRKYKVPVFMIASDHLQEGCIQGRQLALLVPEGEIALCVMGPRSNAIAQQRLAGLNQTKPANLKLLTISGNWTEQSGDDAISSWLKLSTSQQQPISAIVSQNDGMAVGVKRALKHLPSGKLREKLLDLPMIGCDGLPGSGQAWVRGGLLKATVIVPVLAGMALEMLVKAIKNGTFPQEHTFIAPEAYPPLTDFGKSVNKPTAS